MRGTLMILATTTAVAVCPATAQEPKTSLESFSNRDLRQLSETDRQALSKELGKLLPPEYRAGFRFGPTGKGTGGFEDWNIWQLDRKDDSKRFLLLQVRHPHIIPGSAWLAFHLFDKSGKLIRSMECSTGWRSDVKEAVFSREAGLGGNVVQIRTVGVPYTHDTDRQFYGVINDRLALLRVESAKGKLMPNNYSVARFQIGPPPEKRDSAAWEAALVSPNKMEALEALQWLASVHPSDSDPHLAESPNDEPSVQSWKAAARESANLVAVVRKREGVRNAIKKLSESSDVWLREAAQKALDK